VNGLDANRVFDILRGVEAMGTIIPAVTHEGRR
jgi:pyruvate carboxylase